VVKKNEYYKAEYREDTGETKWPDVYLEHPEFEGRWNASWGMENWRFCDCMITVNNSTLVMFILALGFPGPYYGTQWMKMLHDRIKSETKLKEKEC